MSSKKEAKFKATMDIEQVADYLDQVAGSLRSGCLTVENGMEAITLAPDGEVRVELEAIQKSNKESLSLSISWRKAECDSSGEDTRDEHSCDDDAHRSSRSECSTSGELKVSSDARAAS